MHTIAGRLGSSMSWIPYNCLHEYVGGCHVKFSIWCLSVSSPKGYDWIWYHPLQCLRTYELFHFISLHPESLSSVYGGKGKLAPIVYKVGNEWKTWCSPERLESEFDWLWLFNMALAIGFGNGLGGACHHNFHSCSFDRSDWRSLNTRRADWMLHQDRCGVKKKDALLRYWSGHSRYNVKAYLLLHTIYRLYRDRLGGEKRILSCHRGDRKDWKRERERKGRLFSPMWRAGFKAFGLSSSIEE